MRVSWSELLDAYEFASFDGGMGGHYAVVCKRTGRVYSWMDGGDDVDELPEDIEEPGKYLTVPDKRDLDLGKPLVLDFVATALSGDVDAVRRMFSQRGAYARFKDLLAHRGMLERWYAFENEAQEKALRAWCEVNGIELAP